MGNPVDKFHNSFKDTTFSLHECGGIEPDISSSLKGNRPPQAGGGCYLLHITMSWGHSQAI